MPLYEYRCPDCDARYELLQRFADPPATVCRECEGTQLQKLISAPAFQFKGDGWYVTDYARKDGAKKNGDKSDGGSEKADGDAKKADGDGKASGDKTGKTDKSATAASTAKTTKTTKTTSSDS